MAILEGPSLKLAEMIKQELGEGPGDLEKGVRDLRSMCAANPYLPQPEAMEYKEYNICSGRKAAKTFSVKEILSMMIGNLFFCVCRILPILCYLCLGIAYIICQNACCFVFCS